MGDNIIGVQFGIANPEEIISRSVVELVTEKTHHSGLPVSGGVFDSRFGVIENGKVCPTCKNTNLLCPGHFGHIKLARPVYLYQFIDFIRKILTVVCLSCSNPYLKDEDLEGVADKGGLNAVKELTAHTKYVKLGCPHCQTESLKSVDKIDGTVATLEAWTWNPNQEKGIILQTELVLRCFQRITEKHVSMIGLHPKFSRPDWMICTVLAVPPLTVRPSVVMEDNQRMEDDLTHKLITIVRNNQRLKEKIDSSGLGGPVTSESLDMIAKCTELLQFDVATYVDNEIKGLPPSAQRSGRPLKTLRSRLGTKNGRVRGNLMGKRVDFSARSVITPDPNIDLDQLGVPKEIAMNLTFPEIVTEYNRDRLMSCIRNGFLSYPGAKSVYIKHEDKTYSLKFINPDSLVLREGDVVNRHLIDGDVVLFNRQPSLHKASMECHRIVVLPYSTFRLNVSATRPYNADFDGDEMNMHVPQSIVSATEIKYLASVLRQIISPRTASPIIQIFQDTGTGTYRMTQPGVLVPEHIAMNILARMKKPLASYEKSLNGFVKGSTLMSSTFPLINMNGGIVIKDGVLVKGVMGKDAFGRASEGLVHVIYNDFGPTRTGQFINDVQNVITKYNLYSGFSVGSSDLIATAETSALISSKLEEGRRGVSNILSSVHSGAFVNISGRSDGDELESQIVKTLKEIGAAIGEQVISSLTDDNRMKQMVASKTKGSDINITQMMALLGQQLVAGKRIQYTLQDRTLPHFNRFDDGIESRGFVENSFISGIRPAEFFFHAQGGREGLIDTAVKTSDSGYIQRKLVKTLEDLRVMYDGTVRNSTGSIVQFRYAGDGADSISVENQSITLGTMSLENLYKEFAITKDEINQVCSGDVDEVVDLVEELISDRHYIVKNVFRYQKNDMIRSPVSFKRILAKHENTYSTKTDLTPAYVVSELKKISSTNLFKDNLLIQIMMRYFLAPRKSIIVHRFTKAVFDEILAEIKFQYICSRVHTGEMVGTLAAQSIGEPTTQLTLNTFHSAGTAKANGTQGVPRIIELLSVSRNPKSPMNTVYFDNENRYSFNNIMIKKKEIQRTTLRDIVKSVRIYYDPKSTSVEEDKDILETYEKFSLGNKTSQCKSPWIIRLELDEIEMAARNIVDTVQISARIQNNSVLKVFDCIHSDANSKKIIMRIEFDKSNVKNALTLRFIEDKLLDTVLVGIEGISRVYVREINNQLVYDEDVGGYVPKKQWVLDVEGTNIPELSQVKGTDQTKTFSNEIHEVHEIFGIETVRTCLYEEFMEVFSTEYVNYHHVITLIDALTFPGFILSADRFGMSKSDAGVLARSSFEETARHLFNAAVSGEKDPMVGVSANIMMGQKPPCGTGIVDILIDETKLAEGINDVEDEDLDLSSANEQLDAIDKKLGNLSNCRMEDIEMSW